MTTLRPSTTSDIPAMQALIARSGVGLSVGYYTELQARAVTREVFGVDSQLVDDGTYFVIEEQGVIVACGGWSKRSTDYGGDQHKSSPDRLLDPHSEPARIRAFFVEPGKARRGLGGMLLKHCSAAAAQAGFRALELVSTLPGEPLYRAYGFASTQHLEIPLSGGVLLPLIRMRKQI